MPAILILAMGENNIFIPSQVDIATKLQLILSVQLLIIAIVRFYEKRLLVTISITDLILSIYFIYNINRGVLHTENYIELVTLISLYIVFRNINYNQIEPCFISILLFGFFQVLYGFCEQSGFGHTPDFHFERITGTFINTGIFGGYIMILCNLCLCCVMMLSNTKKQYLIYSVLGIFFLYALYNTSSRAAWLASIFTFSYILFNKYNLVKSKILFCGTIFISILFALIAICILNDYKFDSILGRIMVWLISFRMIGSSPIWGMGNNSFQANYMEFQATYSGSPIIERWKYLLDDNIFTFNELLRITVEKGILGLILVLYICYLLIIKTRKEINNLNHNPVIYHIIKILIMALCIFSLFSYPFSIFQLFAFLIILIAIKVSFDQALITIRYNYFQLIGQYSCHLLLITGCWFYISKPYCSSLKYWGDVLRTSQLEQPKETISKLKKIENRLNSEPTFHLSMARLHFSDKQYQKSLKYYDKSNHLRSSYITSMEYGNAHMHIGEYTKADSLFHKARNMVPNRIKPYYYLALSFYKQNKWDDAYFMLQDGLSKPVKVNTIYTNEIILQMKELEKEICLNKK